MSPSATFLLLLLQVLGCLVAPGSSLRISAERYKDEHNLRKRQSGDIYGKLAPSLYWLGNWTVGALPNQRMLIDTGSSDTIVGKGRYQPYNETRFPGHQTFTIEYEGVNRAGFGFQQTNGTLRRDRVAAGGLTVPDQAIGEVVSNKFFDVPTPKNLNLSAGHGIVGFAGPKGSAFVPPGLSWFHHLCADKAISECRFGLAFGSSGVGEVVVGELDSSLIDGSLTTAEMVYREYTVQGDVFLNGKMVFENQTLIMDVGTDNLQGPPGPVLKMFNTLGWQYVVKKGKNLFDPAVPVENIFGYFPCDKPPSIGFGFPSKVNLKSGQTQGVFNVSTSEGVWDVFDQGGNNCTSILGATNALTNTTTGATYWLVGQPFFQEHYVDFNIDSGLIGYGDLKNPKTVT